MYKLLLRPLFFLFDPERIHHFTFGLIKLLHAIPGVTALTNALYKSDNPKLGREVFGIHFPNPVGLAAGFDKDARLVDELAAYGFGFIEVGTLTPKAQTGNDKPRLFRLPQDKGLINRLGFNNGGVEEAVQRLKKRKSGVIIGGNIGKNKVTPNEEAMEDYLIGFETLFPVVDYFVVNVSSPNTPGLRELQEREPLTRLLNALQEKNLQKPEQKPILLKIAPDLTDEQLDDIASIVEETGVAGIVATNTTIDRGGLQTGADRIGQIGNGGLSGAPLRRRSTEVVRLLSAKTNGKVPIIAVGGVFTGEDALEKLEAGASLVQVYTGFVYEGPGMVRRINRSLLRKRN